MVIAVVNLRGDYLCDTKLGGALYEALELQLECKSEFYSAYKVEGFQYPDGSSAFVVILVRV